MSLLSLNVVEVARLYKNPENTVTISREIFSNLNFRFLVNRKFWIGYQFVQYRIYLSYIGVLAWDAGVLVHFITCVRGNLFLKESATFLKLSG